MKPRGSRWLDTALRAQQAKTLDHRYRLHETQAIHEQAVQQESEAALDLHSLSSAWRQSRDGERLTKELDGLYQRFHAQLRSQAANATQARIAHERALDAVLLHLRQSHALQEGLGRTIQRRDRRVTKDAHAKERSVANETWVLAQAARKGSE